MHGGTKLEACWAWFHRRVAGLARVKIRRGELAEVTGRGLRGFFILLVRSFLSSCTLSIPNAPWHTHHPCLRSASDRRLPWKQGYYAAARGNLDQAEIHRYRLNGCSLRGGFRAKEQDMNHVCTLVAEDLACAFIRVFQI